MIIRRCRTSTDPSNAYAIYKNKTAKWEEAYGTKAKSDTVHNKLQNYQRMGSERQFDKATQRKN